MIIASTSSTRFVSLASLLTPSSQPSVGARARLISCLSLSDPLSFSLLSHACFAVAWLLLRLFEDSKLSTPPTSSIEISSLRIFSSTRTVISR